MGIKQLLLILCFGLVTGRSLGQYPIQVMPQLTPPYSLQLSDYYNSTVPKLAVVLTDRDLTRPSVNVRLKMTIAGQSATVATIDNVYYPPITLDAGIPVRVTGSELAPYFNPDNLSFQGITKAQYASQGQLPEGYYQFCFQAIETTTGRAVSANSCAMAWLDLSDPPLLNLPSTASNIALQDPLNIVFSWTPRNAGNPNSAFSTTYDFQMVEITDTTVDPTGAFTMLPPLYTATTQATTFLYGPGQPTLLTGHRYAWRVQAQAMSNGQQLSLFSNNGYSNVNWFTLEDNCQAPLSSTAVTQNGGVHISWIPQSPMIGYEVDYRLQGADTAAWFTQMATADSVVIYDVSPGQTYEYRIGGACSVAGGTTYGNVQAFTVPANDTIGNPNCGILPNINIANQTPLPAMAVNDVFMAGDFPVKVLTTSGTNGRFTGTGYVTVPFLGQAMVKVGWSNAGVNTDHKLISGYVMTAFDASAKQVANVDTVIQTIGNLVNDLDSFVNNYTGSPQDQQQAAVYQQKLDSVAGAIINNPNVPDSVKQPLIAAQSMGDSALKNYETATPCPDSTATQPAASTNANGPNAVTNFDPDYSCNKAAAQTYASVEAATVAAANGVLSKTTPITFCISSDNVSNLKGSLFVDPDGEPVDIGDGVPYMFYSSLEVDLSLPGRLFAYMKNGVIYCAYFNDEGSTQDVFQGYGPLVASGQKLDLATTKRGDMSQAQLVVNDPNCNISVKQGGQVVSSFNQTDCRTCSSWPANYTTTNPVSSKNINYDPTQGQMMVEAMQIACKEVDAMIAAGHVVDSFTADLNNALSTLMQGSSNASSPLFVGEVYAYFQGLAWMAIWHSDDYTSTETNIINNSQITNFYKIVAVNRRILDIQNATKSVLGEGAKTALFIATMELFPGKGPGPRGPRVSATISRYLERIAAESNAIQELIEFAQAEGLTVEESVIRSLYDLFGGNIGFCKRILTSATEAVPGQTLNELATTLNFTEAAPAAGSLTPYQARLWYTWMKSNIGSKVAGEPLEQAARDASNMRNFIRSATRAAMKDQDIANFLDSKELNMTWDQAVTKYSKDGSTGDALYQQIIQASMKGRGFVDNLLQIPIK